MNFEGLNIWKKMKNDTPKAETVSLTVEQKKRLEKDNWHIKVTNTCTKAHEFESMERDLKESAAEYFNIEFLRANLEARKKAVAIQ